MIAASDLFVEALDAFSSQSGSSLSFTDGALTAVARRRRDGQSLTFDNKFRRGSGLSASTRISLKTVGLQGLYPNPLCRRVGSCGNHSRVTNRRRLYERRCRIDPTKAGLELARTYQADNGHPQRPDCRCTSGNQDIPQQRRRLRDRYRVSHRSDWTARSRTGDPGGGQGSRRKTGAALTELGFAR